MAGCLLYCPVFGNTGQSQVSWMVQLQGAMQRLLEKDGSCLLGSSGGSNSLEPCFPVGIGPTKTALLSTVLLAVWNGIVKQGRCQRFPYRAYLTALKSTGVCSNLKGIKFYTFSSYISSQSCNYDFSLFTRVPNFISSKHNSPSLLSQLLCHLSVPFFPPHPSLPLPLTFLLLTLFYTFRNSDN